jgi:uncharacterized protein (DUF305 family)
MKKSLLAFVFVLTSSLIAATAQMSGMNMEKSMSALQTATGKTFDIYWMSQMIAHHGGAVTMAQTELKDGKNAEVKKAAQSIITNQNREIAQMTAWLKSWYGAKPDAKQIALMNADLEPMMKQSRGGMGGMSMGSADKNFLEAMIPHHQSAVDMSQLALKKALRPELKVFAQGVIKNQSAEIKQYKTWLEKL